MSTISDKLRGFAYALSLFEARFDLDAYKILGVSPSVTAEDLKKQYRKLVQLHHPDRGGDTTKLANINRAYEILSDSKKRKEYDLAMGVSAPKGFPGGVGGRPSGGFYAAPKGVDPIIFSVLRQTGQYAIEMEMPPKGPWKPGEPEVDGRRFYRSLEAVKAAIPLIRKEGRVITKIIYPDGTVKVPKGG